jgi:hypothetical protein
VRQQAEVIHAQQRAKVAQDDVQAALTRLNYTLSSMVLGSQEGKSVK